MDGVPVNEPGGLDRFLQLHAGQRRQDRSRPRRGERALRLGRDGRRDPDLHASRQPRACRNSRSSPRAAISTPATAARNFPACWAASIIPPPWRDFRNAGPGTQRRLPQSHALRQFWLAIFRHCANEPRLSATMPATRALPARRCSAARLSPDQRSAQFHAGLAWNVHHRHALAASRVSATKRACIARRLRSRRFRLRLSIQPRRFRRAVHVLLHKGRIHRRLRVRSGKWISQRARRPARAPQQSGRISRARWQPIARLTLNAGARAEDNANFGTRVVPRAGRRLSLARYGKGAFGDTRLHASLRPGNRGARIRSILRHRSLFSRQSRICLRSRAGRSTPASSRSSPRTECASPPIISTTSFTNIISFAFPLPHARLPITAPAHTSTPISPSRAALNLSAVELHHRWLTIAGHYTFDNSRVLLAADNVQPIPPTFRAIICFAAR